VLKQDDKGKAHALLEAANPVVKKDFVVQKCSQTIQPLKRLKI
jgi:hypothetical protein